MNPSIVVAGSINMDLIARCGRLPMKGETLTGLRFDMSHGGKGAIKQSLPRYSARRSQ